MRILKRVAKICAGILIAFALLLGGAQLWNGRGSGAQALGAATPEDIRLASFNVHYILLHKQDGPWSVADWERRRPALTNAVTSLGADIIAFQEMESFRRGDEGSVNLARDALLEEMPAYAAAANGDPKTFPTTQPIFYRKERMTLLDQGWFFFSETPDVIYSRTFNGSFPAFASWAEFYDLRTGKDFRVVNVHFDYSSGENRVKTANLVHDRVAEWTKAGENIVLVGDLNAMAGSKTVDILKQAGLDLRPVKGSTYHLNHGINLFGAIDHVLHDCSTAMPERPVAIRQRFDGVWPSDHYPILAQIRPGAGSCAS
jgi:endonuclease/exonuclease/phosphatase family metal-dependent hydrolase